MNPSHESPMRGTRLNPVGAPVRIAAFISGAGRTLLNLLDEIEAGRLHATVALVIASRPCEGEARARARAVKTEIIPGKIPRERLGSLLREHRIDLGVLAGYLNMVEVPAGFEGRLLNIHPALLPEFGGHGMYGRRVHGAVLASGARESGCTVHIVDDRYDNGAVVLQRRCPVLAGDTPETLAARVFELEKSAYPVAIRAVIAGNFRGASSTNTSPGSEG